MKIKTWQWLLLVPAFSLGLAFLFPAQSNALKPALQNAFQAAALGFYVEEPKIKYRLGGKLEDGEIDCSLFIQVTCEEAGIVEKRKHKGDRTQAWRIYKGLDGFKSNPISFGAIEKADLLALAVPGSLQRPYGINHVGGVIKYKGQWCVIDANSRTMGIRIGPIENIWQKYLPDDGWRRLTIGDEAK